MQIMKNKAEPWLLFSATPGLGAGLPHSGQDSLVARDSRNLGSQAARHEKKCASHKLDVDIPRVLKIKLG